MENNNVLTSIIITEKHFTGDNHKGSSVYGGHIIIKGANRMLISTSRGIRHTITEDGQKVKKKAHVYTAALANNTASESDIYAMIKTNNTKDGLNLYNKELVEIIKENDITFFIDLRGGISNQKSGIIIGDGDLEYIGHNEEFRKTTEELFNSFGISVKFSESYQAKKPYAPANIVYRNTGIPSVQFLVNIAYRSPNENLDKYLSFQNALNQYISLSMKIFNDHTFEK